MYIKRNIFNKYWEILKQDKNDKTHTNKQRDTYFSIFKNVEEEIFVESVKEMLLRCSYFPRIDEMEKFISGVMERNKAEKLVKNRVKNDLLSSEDKKFFKQMFYQFCDSEEEAEEKIRKFNI